MPEVTFLPRSAQRAHADLGRRRARLSVMVDTGCFISDLREIVTGAVPVKDEAAWPTDIAELAGKIERENAGGLRSFEAPVRDKDRQIVAKGLPPCIEIQRNDHRYH